MSNFSDDVTDGYKEPINTGESSIDKVLSGIEELGAKRERIKTWSLAALPEDELVELVITFTDLGDGTVETAV